MQDFEMQESRVCSLKRQAYSQALTSLSRTCLLELEVGNHLFDSSSKLSSNPTCSASDSHDQHCHTPHDAKIARRALFEESVKKSLSRSTSLGSTLHLVPPDISTFLPASFVRSSTTTLPCIALSRTMCKWHKLMEPNLNSHSAHSYVMAGIYTPKQV